MILASIAAIIIAALAISVTLLIRHTTINVIIRKDPDMSTIKDRIAALEADNAKLKVQLADHDTTLANTTTTDDMMAMRSNLASGIDAVTARVANVEAEIGTDPTSADATTEAAPAAAAPDPAFAPIP